MQARNERFTAKILQDQTKKQINQNKIVKISEKHEINKQNKELKEADRQYLTDKLRERREKHQETINKLKADEEIKLKQTNKRILKEALERSQKQKEKEEEIKAKMKIKEEHERK